MPGRAGDTRRLAFATRYVAIADIFISSFFQHGVNAGTLQPRVAESCRLLRDGDQKQTRKHMCEYCNNLAFVEAGTFSYT
jgi:hypothetical protein